MADNVARVSPHYPAGVIGGFDQHHIGPVTYTTKPVGNLVVITAMRKGNRLDSPAPMTWYNTLGHVIKTINRL